MPNDGNRCGTHHGRFHMLQICNHQPCRQCMAISVVRLSVEPHRSAGRHQSHGVPAPPHRADGTVQALAARLNMVRASVPCIILPPGHKPQPMKSFRCPGIPSSTARCMTSSVGLYMNMNPPHHAARSPWMKSPRSRTRIQRLGPHADASPVVPWQPTARPRGLVSAFMLDTRTAETRFRTDAETAPVWVQA